jgi:hypothetical protein
MFIYLESIGCPNDSLPFPVSQMVVIPLSVAAEEPTERSLVLLVAADVNLLRHVFLKLRTRVG